MRRLALICLMLLLFGTLFALAPTAKGQTGTPTPARTDSTPTLAADAILDQANKANEEAARSNQSAADAINIVNSMLGFIQVAAIVGGALAALSATAFAYTGIRTISEYRQELGKARAELDEMRATLEAETAEVRGQGDRAIRALALMQLGEQQLEAKNIRAALRVYREAFELDPDNRAVNYFLGELYVQEKELTKGIEHLERALSGGRDYAPAEAALAYALRLQGDQAKDPSERNLHYAEAETRFLKAIKDDPAVRDINGESVYGVLGGLYKRQGRIEDAIRCYTEATKVTPQNSYPIVNLAMLLFQQGKAAEAEPYFKRSAAMSERLIDGNPFDYWARFDLIAAQLVLGSIEPAKRNLEIVTHQLQSVRPLEIFLADLHRLRDAPQPPDGVNEIIETVEQAITRLRAHNP